MSGCALGVIFVSGQLLGRFASCSVFYPLINQGSNYVACCRSKTLSRPLELFRRMMDIDHFACHLLKFYSSEHDVLLFEILYPIKSCYAVFLSNWALVRLRKRV